MSFENEEEINRETFGIKKEMEDEARELFEETDSQDVNSTIPGIPSKICNGIFSMMKYISTFFSSGYKWMVDNPLFIFAVVLIIAIILKIYFIDSLPPKLVALHTPIIGQINKAFQYYMKKYIGIVPIGTVIGIKRLIEIIFTPGTTKEEIIKKATEIKMGMDGGDKKSNIKNTISDIVHTEGLTIGTAMLYGLLFNTKNGLLTLLGAPDVSGHILLILVNILTMPSSNDPVESGIKMAWIIGMIVAVFFTVLYFHTVPETLLALIAGKLLVHPLYNICWYIFTKIYVNVYARIFSKNKQLQTLQLLEPDCTTNEHLRTWTELFSGENRICVPNVDDEICVDRYTRTRTWKEWKAGKKYCDEIKKTEGKKTRNQKHKSRNVKRKKTGKHNKK
jgi:hypothetical protein